MKQLLSQLLPAQSGRERMQAIVAGFLFVLGLCLCTGIEANPRQAIVALPMLGAACAIFNKIDPEK